MKAKKAENENETETENETEYENETETEYETEYDYESENVNENETENVSERGENRVKLRKQCLFITYLSLSRNSVKSFFEGIHQNDLDSETGEVERPYRLLRYDALSESHTLSLVDTLHYMRN